MPTPTSTEAAHALTLEPHADGTYDPAAHELSTACTVTLSISYQLTTTRERIDERGAKQGVIETHKLNRFEEIVRGLVAGGAPYANSPTGLLSLYACRSMDDANRACRGGSRRSSRPQRATERVPVDVRHSRRIYIS